MKFFTKSPLAVVFLTVAALSSTLLGAASISTPTNAANKSDWIAGNIISDAIFTKKDSMSTNEIQAFLNKQIGTCDVQGTGKAVEYNSTLTRAQYAKARGWPGPPYVCINKYYEVPKATPGSGTPKNNWNKDLTIPTGAKSAAWIIKDAANRYNISPKVLLVKIATESAGPLTSDKWPLYSQYKYAMGSHCPDSGPGGSANCDSNYAGFSIQMYSAAELMRWYLDSMQESWWSYKKPYQNNNILWNIVESGCGSGKVYIQNKATAALYTYTPYQPNSAALNNMYGTGNSCSAYGNRNFWRVYVDWFGSTRFIVGGAIGNKYAAKGGSAGFLGEPLSNEKRLSDGTVYQQFEGGRIYWKSRQGTWVVSGGIGNKYINIGASDKLGSPLTDEIVLPTGGVYQQFEHGRIYWKSRQGTWVVSGGIGNKYIGLSADAGTLGYPLSDEAAYPTGGMYQQFEGGRIYWKSGLGGARKLDGNMLAYHISNDGAKGILGQPTSDATNSNGTVYQSFEYALVHRSASSQTFVAAGAIGEKYKVSGGVIGTLGAPQGNEIRSASGAYQQFEHGRIYWKSKVGSWIVKDAMLSHYFSRSGSDGALGYPLSDAQNLASSNLYQKFEGGVVYKISTNFYTTLGAVGDKYDSKNSHTGYLGLPASNEVPVTTGGVYQQFEHGRIYWKSRQGTWVVSGGIGTRYISLGAHESSLGRPTGDENPTVNGQVYQQFEHGRIYWKSGSGTTVKYN